MIHSACLLHQQLAYAAPLLRFIMAMSQDQKGITAQATRERIAFVLIDGLADIHIPDLASLTPLEAADTPTMDAVSGR